MDVRRLLRRVYAISWLSWMELSNWTKPFIFLIYSLVKPISSILIYAYIYLAFLLIAGETNIESGFYLLTGGAFFNIIESGVYGVVWVIHDEREHYETLRFTYISYPSLYGYLVSRGLPHYLIGVLPTVAVLLIGLPLVGYPMENLSPNLLILLINFILCVLWCSSLSALISSLTLFSSEYGTLVADSFGGFLLLVGGVLFPSSSLPQFIQPLAEIFPLQEWMELNRWGLNNRYPIDVPLLLWSQVLKTIFWIILSFIIFNAMERLVRKKGLLEAVTTH